jgi:hypothetical protein
MNTNETGSMLEDRKVNVKAKCAVSELMRQIEA